MIIINRGHRKEELNSHLKQLQNDVRLNLEGNINFASSSFLPISSTQIRTLLEQGKSVSELVAPGVEEYIRKHSLYQRR